MKKMLKIVSAVAAAATIGLVASTSVQAGDSFAFSFGYGGGGGRGWHRGPRYGINFGYAYCPPPVYYCAPPPPPVVYYRPAPVYYYSGGSYYCYR